MKLKTMNPEIKVFIIFGFEITVSISNNIFNWKVCYHFHFYFTSRKADEKPSDGNSN